MADEDDRKWLPPTDSDDDKPGDTLPGVPGSFSGGPDVPGSGPGGLSSGDPLAGGGAPSSGSSSGTGGESGAGLWSSQPGPSAQPSEPPAPGGGWGAPSPPQQPAGGDTWGTPTPPTQPGGGDAWGAPQQQTYQPYGQQASSDTNNKAVAALVLGIVGLVLCPLICPILALIFGYQARGEIDGSGGRQGGRGLAVAGIIIGWIGIAWTAVIVLLIALGVAFGDSSDDDFSGIGRPAVVRVVNV